MHSTKPKNRALKQNASLHLYFELLAEELNGSGLDMKKVLKPSIDISWSKQNIKEYLWRPIQFALLQNKSTRNLTTAEIDKVFDELNRHLGEKFGIHVAFPSIEQIAEMEVQEKKVINR